MYNFRGRTKETKTKKKKQANRQVANHRDLVTHSCCVFFCKGSVIPVSNALVFVHIFGQKMQLLFSIILKWVTKNLIRDDTSVGMEEKGYILSAKVRSICK